VELPTAVDGQAALLLEVAHRQLDVLVIGRAGHRVGPEQPDPLEERPDLGNRRPGVAASEHGAGCLGVHPGRSCRRIARVLVGRSTLADVARQSKQDITRKRAALRP